MKFIRIRTESYEVRGFFDNSFLHGVMRLIKTSLVFLSATLLIPVIILGAITSPLWCWFVAYYWAKDYYKGDA